eukprot:TRINITY_DN8334_c0_g1_i2.p1 TRINITY_DN8334_c0_g1~~TRINITY_DN8334_c0_g1_i2.p1  ORF type:complete len:107 (+),score=14.02 TRINITY_DN8334_c0_g1_i2:212-532(+)
MVVDMGMYMVHHVIILTAAVDEEGGGRLLRASDPRAPSLLVVALAFDCIGSGSSIGCVGRGVVVEARSEEGVGIMAVVEVVVCVPPLQDARDTTCLLYTSPSPRDS